MIKKVVIDTNVFVGALRRNDGINRVILEMAFLGEVKPLMGDALYLEYQDLIGRDHLYEDSVLNEWERWELFDAFCSVCQWMEIYYKWRPNLKDEGDNHLIELAAAGNAPEILSWNKRDFQGGDLMMPDIRIISPVEFVRRERNIL